MIISKAAAKQRSALLVDSDIQLGDDVDLWMVTLDGKDIVMPCILVGVTAGGGNQMSYDLAFDVVSPGAELCVVVRGVQSKVLPRGTPQATPRSEQPPPVRPNLKLASVNLHPAPSETPNRPVLQPALQTDGELQCGTQAKPTDKSAD